MEDAAVEGPADVGIEVGVPMEEEGDSMIEEENFSFYVFILRKIMAPHSTPKIRERRESPSCGQRFSQQSKGRNIYPN